MSLSYLVTGRLGLLLAFSHGSVTPVWAPSGIAVAALHLLGLRAWPAVMLGAFLVNVSTGPTLAASVVIAVGNTLEGVVGAYLLRRLIGEDGRFDRLRDVVSLAVVASLSAIVAALVGVLCLSVLGPRPVSPRDVAIVWWAGDAIGILLVTSLVITWLRPAVVARTTRLASLVEWSVVVALAVVATVSAFQRGIIHGDGLFHPLAFMPLPIVVWAAARLGTRGATTLTLLVATIAIARTAQWSPSASVALAQIAVLLTFIAIVSMTGLVVSAVVSAHAAAEASLERRHAQYAALVEALPDLIMRVAREGTVLDAHAPSGGALGVAEDEVAGRPLSSVVPAALLTDVSPAIASGGSARVEAMWPAPGGGAARAVEVRVVPSGADEATLICRDVTELRDAQSKLVMADRLASIGTLAAGVAHEINNPLTFVGASLDLVERLHDASDAHEPSQRAKVRSSIEAAKVGLDRIARIVRDLLRLARPQSDEGPLDLNATIDLAARMAQREIAPRARLVTNLAPPPRVRGSEARVGQVVLNLLVNAAQSLPDGAPDAHEIRVVTREAEDGGAIIEVQDDGPGIPPDVLAHVFEPFFTTKPAGMGTGLGLSICQQILTSMGGEISIESAVGIGTTVRVVLPSVRSPG